jgi:hypothetical protein
MPSVVSSYVYTFAALVAVSALLIFSVNSYAYSLRVASEQDQLQNILTGVAAKANEILTLVTTTNSSVTVSLNMPTAIGDQYYWLRIRNDSSQVWVEGALGEFHEDATGLQVLIPGYAVMSGYFVSARGIAILRGYMVASIPQLNLTWAGE